MHIVTVETIENVAVSAVGVLRDVLDAKSAELSRVSWWEDGIFRTRRR